jgi:hypothetical protein
MLNFRKIFPPILNQETIARGSSIRELQNLREDLAEKIGVKLKVKLRLNY